MHRLSAKTLEPSVLVVKRQVCSFVLLPQWSITYPDFLGKNTSSLKPSASLPKPSKPPAQPLNRPISASTTSKRTVSTSSHRSGSSASSLAPTLASTRSAPTSSKLFTRKQQADSDVEMNDRSDAEVNPESDEEDNPPEKEAARRSRGTVRFETPSCLVLTKRFLSGVYRPSRTNLGLVTILVSPKSSSTRRLSTFVFRWHPTACSPSRWSTTVRFGSAGRLRLLSLGLTLICTPLTATTLYA